MNKMTIVSLTFLGKRTGRYELLAPADNPYGYVVLGAYDSRAQARAAMKAAKAA